MRLIKIFEVGCNSDIDQYSNLYLSKRGKEDYEYTREYEIDSFFDFIELIKELETTPENLYTFFKKIMPLFDKHGFVK